MQPLSNLSFRARRLPVILQTESGECALACLAMVASYHGYRTDLPTLRGRFSISVKGASMALLVRLADRLKLGSRALRLEVDELADLKTPCILHWNLNHFVVLKKADHKGITIHDPAIGERFIAYAEVSQQFTGVALEMFPNSDFKSANEVRRISMRGLMGKVDGLWRSMGLVFAMAIALEAFALVAPLFNQWVIDEAIVAADRSLLNILILGFALLLLTQGAISLARSWTVMYLATHLNVQWAGNVFSHLIRLPVAWFEKRHLGDIVSRFGSTNTIQATLTTSFIAAIIDGIMAIATLVMMYLYSAQLAAIVLVAVALYALLRTLSFKSLRDANHEVLLLSSKEQSCFLETMRAVQAIKLANRELDRRSHWLNLKVDTVNRNVRTQKFMLWFGFANMMIFGFQNLAVFWLGAHMVMDGSFSVGMLIAFTTYGGQFGGRMASLIDKTIEFRMLFLHGERLADIVLEEVEPNIENDVDIGTLEPRIELIDVGFRYSDSEPWIVRNFNLTIEAGSSLALTGPSGCGKTTLVKLILGLLPVSEGEIRYGGVLLERLGNQAYRRVLAVVMQDDQLLAGSLAENIAFFDPHSDQERIEACARQAAMHADITAMPMGYHTLCGDMGTSLSGGQKQRVLLARALYKAPRLLVLDEATSHLDVSREKEVNDAIRALSVTRISVAHRPETIAMAERVIRMSHGKIEADYLQTSLAA